MAASGERNWPPSLKESGVMLTTPMTSVRAPSERVRVRRRQVELSLAGAVIRGLSQRKMPCGAKVAIGRVIAFFNVKARGQIAGIAEACMAPATLRA